MALPISPLFLSMKFFDKPQLLKVLCRFFYYLCSAMGRLLAIDYGRKRTGIAVTDTLQIVATALATVPTHALMQFLKDYLAKEPVDLFVVGEPRKLDGTPSESTRYIHPFLHRLRNEFPHVPVVSFDERFTSTLAHRALIEGGASKSTRREKSIVDSMAATIILNDYLQSKQYNK